ncbi:GntR family transcriptional regulator [bacterium]|nr:GntR family transcriptional regulator [bacterium]
MRRIELSEMAPHVHSFHPKENKADKISKWLISWIAISLGNKTIQPLDLLPTKAEFAFHLGVSLGTMQNVFRFVEDAGYIESKQRIGSYIKLRGNTSIQKLTSKKDFASDSIKKYLKQNNFKPGDRLISGRQLAKELGLSTTTVRAAIAELILQGILEKDKKNFILTGRSFSIDNIKKWTLAEKLAESISKHVLAELSPGDKIPPSTVLAKRFKVSTKTIHSAIKQLTKEGVLLSRRGRYGTYVVNKKTDSVNLYNYEIIEQKIKKYIHDNCANGDKLPSIKELAIRYNTSAKTVKKALDSLYDSGYITFMRGRYGGTFVLEIPQSAKDSYTWLAINSDYINELNN